MCLAIPGQIISLTDDSDPIARKGRDSFSGISKEISLAYVPEAKTNDYVIVHAGLAINVIDEDEAQVILNDFRELLGDDFEAH
jgi:hydrogenase expression/formation protein HypC